MLFFYPLKIETELSVESPLHVGHFYKLPGMWWKKRKLRQSLILSVAVAWYNIARGSHTIGFEERETYLCHLTTQVRDAHVILEKFFEITKRGYSYHNGDRSPSILRPKRLPKRMVAAIKNLLKTGIEFDPDDEPVDSGLTASTVHIQQQNKQQILAKLEETGRCDLIPAAEWLLARDSVQFYYERAGRLGARDKSVWPVKSIETWPGWLRTDLFGRTVDIENAFCQFLIGTLRNKKYASCPELLELKYPDIVKSDTDRAAFRSHLCTEYLKAEDNDENIRLIKKLIMSLANGSNASPALLISSRANEAAKLVRQINDNLSVSDIICIGNKLNSVARQFKAAKRELCTTVLKLRPTRENVKKVFHLYLGWERESRYALWECTGRTGLMLHDGLDGLHDTRSAEDLVQYICDQTNIRVTVDA